MFLPGNICLMSTQNDVVPVYSYKRFKELAEDRMNQVKIYVQNRDTWLPSGTGILHFFQILPGLMLKELMAPQDYDPAYPSLFILVEVPHETPIPEAEMRVLSENYAVLNSKPYRIPNVILFYDIREGNHFEYDVERSINRENCKLVARQLKRCSNRAEFRL